MSSDDLNNRIRETVSRLRDEDLIKMIGSASRDYTPFALEVARQELSRRGGIDSVKARLKARESPPVHIKLPRHNGGTLVAFYEEQSTWDYTILDENHSIVARINLSTGEMLVDGSMYQFRRIMNGPDSGDLLLEYEDYTLARARYAVLRRTCEISYAGSKYILKPPMLFHTSFQLFSGDNRIGSISSEGLRSRDMTFSTSLPLPVCGFIFWLVPRSYKKWQG